jgi:hypothetical protein
MNKLVLAIKTVPQLGLKYSLLYGIYRFGLWSGHYHRETPSSFFLPIPDLSPTNVNWPIPKQNKDALQKILLSEKKDLLDEAVEILNGRFRFFGGPTESFTFNKQGDLPHWSAYELGKASVKTEDIKLIWEPARFGWAFILARAYAISNNENYAQCFWHLFDEFTSANPFNSGPNWSSAQEVALRLIALIFAGSIFRTSKSATSQRMLMLLASIYMHAKRISPTLVYARAQNNNHLISESVGLYCAGSFFKSLPITKKWKALGWKWFNHAIQEQISENGEFIQHSLNYHRLMLQASLWMDFITRTNNEKLPDLTLEKLTIATGWLLNFIEPTSGHVPNLGHNDGSNIFPLSQCAYADYRPVAQAASRAFLKKSLLPSGIWDESCYWLNLPISTDRGMTFKPTHTNGVPWLGDSISRVYLQSVKYRNRPAHADQLHVDFWHKGYNLAMDAGTYSYNALPPWENALAQTLVHNSIIIDGTSQMNRAGKFLWLDWAQASLLQFDPVENTLKAYHDGYKKLGINHEREINFDHVSKWHVLDTLNATKSNPKEHLACLHWLLPDWPWKLDGHTLILKAPFGKVILTISGNGKVRPEIDLIRCGKSLLLKRSASPILGWYSPTYNFKEPALSLTYSDVFTPPMQITSLWQILEKQG